MSFNKKIYIEYPYLTEFDTEVIECKENSDGNFEIKLKETIFYPHMVGGQLKDYGQINNIEVINTKEDENTEEVIHVTKEAIFGPVHLCIDKERRFDLMQQHTGQHILSAAFWTLYKGKTVGFHMSDLYTTIDIALSDANEDMINQVEKLANSSIYSNLDVECNVYTREEAIATGLRKPPVNCNTIRTVKIGQIDNIACCGTHLSKTGEVRLIKIIKYENYKGGLRVEFLCGKRALNYYQNINSIINIISNDFSCKYDELIYSIDKLKKHNEYLNKKITNLNKSLSIYEVEELKKEADLSNTTLIKVYENQDSKHIRNVMTELIKENDIKALFINNTDKGLNILYGKSNNLEFDLKKSFTKLMDLIGGRGGGSPYICQGSCKEVNKIDIIIDYIRKQ